MSSPSKKPSPADIGAASRFVSTFEYRLFSPYPGQWNATIYELAKEIALARWEGSEARATQHKGKSKGDSNE